MKTFFTPLILLSGCLLAGNAHASGIDIDQATYGLNCNPGLRSNMTHIVSRSCEDKSLCRFTIDHEKYGDPAPNCAKNFIVEYHCEPDDIARTAIIGSEATKHYVTLDCPE